MALPRRAFSHIYAPTMRNRADFTIEGDEGAEQSVALSGPLLVSSIGDLDTRLGQFAGEVKQVDLAQVSDIDTAGAWLAWRFAEGHQAEITGASEKAERLIAAISTATISDDVKPERPGTWLRVTNSIGDKVFGAGRGIKRTLGFIGTIIVSAGAIIRHPSRFRGKALIHQMELVGVTSLGIIGLMSFLVGIVIAQQGAVQLAQFGAEMLTVNLTGRIAMRELGILMTAIMVAGRSGSAFAAQIGTMKLTEEIDAMRTIGVSPVEALVVPRILASMLMMPLLGFYATVLAIVGGAFISAFQLGIPFFTFLSRIQEVVPIHDFYVGLIKAPVFGLIIALSGCYHGMQVEANSEEVGLRTTMAVVAAIFTVIVLDAFFAVFFSELGWG